MIGDFLQFLEYYHTSYPDAARPYNDPLVRIEYDAVDKAGNLTLALMAPFAHAICTLCYREPEFEPHYNQKNIAEVCHVSSAEVSSWKKETRIPEKYRWFLLLVDISARCGNIYGHNLLHGDIMGVCEVCDSYLRMVKACCDPFCRDDVILADAVRRAVGIDVVSRELMLANPEFWNRVFM